MKIKDYYKIMNSSFIEGIFVQQGSTRPDWYEDFYHPNYESLDFEYLNLVFGEYETFADDEDTIRKHIKGSCISNLYKFKTLYESIIQEYNPIENYDKYEQITTTYEGTETNTNTGSNTISYEGSESNTTSRSGTDTTTHSGTDTTTRSGSETDTLTKSGQEKNSKLGTETTTESSAIFNLGDAQTGKTKTDYGTTQPIVDELSFTNRQDSTTHTINNLKDEQSVNLTDTINHSTTDTSTRDFNGRQDSTSSSGTNIRSFDNRQDIVLNRTHGNIGVTTAGQMLAEHRRSAEFNFIQEVYSTIINDIAYLVMGVY